MQFTRIVLCKYKRLALNHIEEIEITPKNKMQLLLGANGSGKSSILSQLTPLPANHQDFHKGGYKIVEIIHNNSRYELKSLFVGPKNHYHFIKDGVELNDGLTTTTFTELVKKEFGITPETHAITTGAVTFSGMSSAERRSCFTKISDADYTFAIQYYKRLTEKYRDLMGYIKTQQSRLVLENDKLLTPEMEEKYSKEIASLQELLSHYVGLKGPIKTPMSTLRARASDIEVKLVQLTGAYRKQLRTFSNQEGFTSSEGIDDKIVGLRAQQTIIERDMGELAVVIEREDELLVHYNSSTQTAVTDVDKQLETLEAAERELKSQILLDIVFEDNVRAQQALSSVYDRLHYIAKELVANPDKGLSRDSYYAAIERANMLDAEMVKLNNHITVINKRKEELEHFRIHSKVECPKCNHVWFTNYSDSDYDTILAKIASAGNDHATLTAKISEQAEYVLLVKNYLERYRDYAQLSSAWTDLNPLWDYISKNSILFNTPGRLTSIADNLKGDLAIWLKIDQLRIDIEASRSLKRSLALNCQQNIAAVIKSSSINHEKFYALNIQAQWVKSEIAKLTRYKSSVAATQLLISEMEELSKQFQDNTVEMVEVCKMETLNRAIQAVHIELSDREQTISQQQMQRGIVFNIQEQIRDCADKAELLKIAITELSPTEGLIAKGLTGFINNYTAQMNMFIKKVWLYPMELAPILPSETDELDLDYKFKVIINNNPNPDDMVPDIIKGSAGMREIIDLAFKVVYMHYLGLDKCPLVLDEFGTKLDPAHRHSVQNGINSMIASSNFSQIYMVSHYENCYGSMVNADVCVVHPANVHLPKDMAYNTHVKIT